MPFSVQAHVPRKAFDALDLANIVGLAKVAGIDRPRVESSTHKIPNTYPFAVTRVTCSIEMALAIVEAFKLLASKAEEAHDTDLLIAVAHAVKALLDGADEAREQLDGDS